jgi:cytochrome c peroxidase
MTLLRSRARLIILIVALAAVAALVVVMLASSDDKPVAQNDPHAIPNVPAAKMKSTLAATEAASTATSKAELASQGRALFNDPSVAKRGESCGGCHTIGTSNESIGLITHNDANGKVLFARDPPSLIGAARTNPMRWTGDVPTLQQQVVNTIFNHFKNGKTQPPEKTAQQAAALVAYISTIRAPTSPFDQGTMSPAAIRGETLFQGKGACIACHGGPLFTDNNMHNTLVPQRNGWHDPGATVTGFPGFFNTPQLRDVRNTAPYMHNGVFKTLRDVIDFYNARSSIAPLHLTPQEIDDLVAYMDAL